LAKLSGGPPYPSIACRFATFSSVIVTGTAVSLFAGLASPADAAPRGSYRSYGWYGGYYSFPYYSPGRRARPAPQRRDAAEPRKEAGFGEMPKGTLQIVVSINSQKVTLFSDGIRVAQGPVSTGVPGHPTPTGVFSVIEKDRYHHSNLYSNAPMPYMQRITWSGVALHEGVLPGYPASHGCIRMSRDFAQKLWPTTKLGARVIVTHGDIVPIDFAHPKLFAPNPKPPAPPIASNDAGHGQASASPVVVAQLTPPVDDQPTSEAAPVDRKPAPTLDPAKPIAPRLRPADQPVKRSGQVAVFVSRKEMKIFVRQGMVPLFDMPIVIDAPDQPIGTHVFTALALTDNGAGMRWNLMTVPNDLSLPATDAKEARRKFREPLKPTAHLKAPSTAAEALNRIQMPKEAAERISELLIPGSSLVVSDEGLGRETGRYTEFIVLTR
jgi:hypothetical protein